MVIPCVGWNTQGNRLGFGGGAYDSTLANFSGKKIGIAWEMGEIKSKI